MIPEPFRKQVGEEIHQVMMTARLTGTTKDANAWQLIRVLQPYLKTISAHSMTALYVDALLKFRAAVRHYGRNSIHLRKDLNRESPFPLSFDQVTNFAKLRMFGLAVHANKENSRSGLWLLTARGNDFLNGTIAIPKMVYTFRGHPLHADLPGEKRVHILEYKRELPEFETYYDYVPPRPTKPVDRTEKLPIFTT
ncbi:MAG TPA: hypothetical protein VLC46_26770 [Thermoanaerobaculia bacterium]|jgi:hypothetical protein|nr:hypothetical protein [Thermoanaerobaculia bacterium]